MIAFVNGPVMSVEDDSIIVSTGAIGYSLLVPMSRIQPRPVIGNDIFLYTHLQIQDDAWNLFGFSDQEQLKLFRMLLNVSGVGAKTALAIIDAINPVRFIASIKSQDIKTFTNVKGIGKKTAERIILELKDKFKDVIVDEESEMIQTTAPEDAESSINKELLAALKQLGYSATEARAFAIQAEAQLGSDATPESLLRAALKIAHNA